MTGIMPSTLPPNAKNRVSQRLSNLDDFHKGKHHHAVNRKRIKIMSALHTNDSVNVTSLYSYCLRNNNMNLLREWNEGKNGELRPWNVSYGSNRKVWWKCDMGHEWQTAIKARMAGCSCPVCRNRVVTAGFNDFAANYPQLAREWHPEKNFPVTQEEVFAGSVKQYWWKCEKGHEWKARIASRVRGNGCPVCAGRQVVKGFNDFASLFPELAEEWVTENNLPLTPETVTPYSNKRVWWRCAKGHEWQAYISARSSSFSKCPYCTGKMVLTGFNDLATVCPKVAAEWNIEKNGNFTPEMVTVGSHKRVWWKCPEGHEWRAVIYSRTGAREHGCPICAGRKTV